MAQASPELIDKLAKAPLKIRLGVLFGVLAVLGGGYWYVFYSDLDAELTDHLKRRDKLARDEKTLMQRKKEYDDLLQKKMALEEDIRRNSVRLPASSELPSFFAHLQSQALASNVHLLKSARANEVPVESYVKVPVQMEVAGEFHQINQYFKLLSETPRIITIENLTIGEGRTVSDAYLLTAKFTASTFRQADQPPSASVSPQAPAKPAVPPAPKAGPRPPGMAVPPGGIKPPPPKPPAPGQR
jgi:type IV pilus assembly protein PilO